MRFHWFRQAESLDTESIAGRLVINIMTAVSQREREAIGERTRDTLNQITAGGGVACGIRTAVAAGHGQRSVAWTWERPIDQHTMEIFWVRVQRTVHLRRVLPHFSFSTNLAASWAKLTTH